MKDLVSAEMSGRLNVCSSKTTEDRRYTEINMRNNCHMTSTVICYNRINSSNS